jgi:hypothetical protein
MDAKMGISIGKILDELENARVEDVWQALWTEWVRGRLKLREDWEGGHLTYEEIACIAGHMFDAIPANGDPPPEDLPSNALCNKFGLKPNVLKRVLEKCDSALPTGKVAKARKPKAPELVHILILIAKSESDPNSQWNKLRHKFTKNVALTQIATKALGLNASDIPERTWERVRTDLRNLVDQWKQRRNKRQKWRMSVLKEQDRMHKVAEELRTPNRKHAAKSIAYSLEEYRRDDTVIKKLLEDFGEKECTKIWDLALMIAAPECAPSPRWFQDAGLRPADVAKAGMLGRSLSEFVFERLMNEPEKRAAFMKGITESMIDIQTLEDRTQ